MRKIEKKDKELIVKICDFILKIEFQPFFKNEEYYDTLYQRKRITSELKKYLHNFITHANHQKVHSTIIFKSEPLTVMKHATSQVVSANLFTISANKKIQTSYHISISQFQLILRDVIYQLTTRNNGCVIHGSAIGIDNTASLFLGPSRAGKSTVLRLVKNVYKPLADDTIFIKKIGKKFFVFQTPFIEKQWWIKKQNGRFELKNIFFIKQGKQSFTQKIEDKTVLFPFLLDQTLVPHRRKKNIIQLSADLLSSSVQFYALTFRKNKEDIKELITSVYTNKN